MNQNNLGIYVHIPFCVSKCCYCDFLSFPGIGEDKVEAYFDALMKEIEYRAPIFEGNRIETIYIGGGTPSAVPPFYIEKVIEKIRSMTVLEEGLERTIEINPDSCSDEKLEVYRQIGLNRISMGLQSGQDDVLKKIGRIHTVHQFYDAYERLIRWGFDNINIDLMSGLPGQTKENFTRTLEEVVKLQPKHLSAYGLILEEGTSLSKQYEKGKYRIDDEAEREMYEILKEKTTKEGYEHYEISNFAKEQAYSKHNLRYWELKDYLGLGLGSHSFVRGERFANTRNLETYVQKGLQGAFIKEESRILTKKEWKEEFLFLGLRKRKGIRLSDYRRFFSSDLMQDYGKRIKKLSSQGLLMMESDRLFLTDRGLDYANLVFAEFIDLE